MMTILVRNVFASIIYTPEENFPCKVHYEELQRQSGVDAVPQRVRHSGVPPRSSGYDAKNSTVETHNVEKGYLTDIH